MPTSYLAHLAMVFLVFIESYSIDSVLLKCGLAVVYLSLDRDELIGVAHIPVSEKRVNSS